MDANRIMRSLLGRDEDLAARTQLLGRMVLDLFMEVEALRRVVKELSDRAGPVEPVGEIHSGVEDNVPQPRTPYKAAYVETAWLTHCASGPTSGWDKLLAEFYGRGQSAEDWREELMLKRLGFSKEDITRYKENARIAEQYS